MPLFVRLRRPFAGVRLRQMFTGFLTAGRVSLLARPEMGRGLKRILPLKSGHTFSTKEFRKVTSETCLPILTCPNDSI